MKKNKYIIILAILFPLIVFAQNKKLSKEEKEKKYAEYKKAQLEKIIKIDKKYGIKMFNTYEEYAKAWEKVRNDLVKNPDDKDALLAAYRIAFKIKNNNQYDFPIRIYCEKNWKNETWLEREGAVSSIEGLIFDKKGNLTKELKQKLIIKLNKYINEAPLDNTDASRFVSSAKDLLQRLEDYKAIDDNKTKKNNNGQNEKKNDK